MIVVAIGLIATLSFRRLLTEALYTRFEKTLAAEVYQLKFQNLEVNPLTRNITIANVEIFPRDTSQHQYSYINSRLHLTTRKIILENVRLAKLLWGNALELDKIKIVQPDVDFTLANHNIVFFPFREAQADSIDTGKKQALVSFVIKELDLEDAHFHVMNIDSSREGELQGINISLREITIQRETERDKIAYQHFDFSFDELNGKWEHQELRNFHFQDFKLRVDSLYFEQTPDTVMYHFSDANISGHQLDIQTADSLFNIALDSFYLHYRDRSIVLNHVSYTPNASEVALQKRYPYRKEIFDVKADSIHVSDINFDSLMYVFKVFAKEIFVDSLSGSIYKNLTKPFPPHHRPKYLGQQVMEYSIPISIDHVKITHAQLLNTEVKPDGGIGKVNITRGTVDIFNITNLPTTEPLKVEADAYVENAAHAYVQLNFRYDLPQYTINANVKPFEMASLNSFISSYSPAKINKGTSDGITFSGTVYERYSRGNMKWLYHDLSIEMAPADKVTLTTIIKGLLANTIINNANPPSDNQPTREVQVYVDRDMRTGFILMMVKSVLEGIQETLVMSKDNKMVYREAKDEMKKKEKAEKNGNR